jgi:hypothetical protein
MGRPQNEGFMMENPIQMDDSPSVFPCFPHQGEVLRWTPGPCLLHLFQGRRLAAPGDVLCHRAAEEMGLLNRGRQPSSDFMKGLAMKTGGFVWFHPEK